MYTFKFKGNYINHKWLNAGTLGATCKSDIQSSADCQSDAWKFKLKNSWTILKVIHNPSSVSSQTLKLAECPNDLIIFIGGTAIPWVSIDGHHTLSAVSQTPQVVTPAELSPYLMWFDVRGCDKKLLHRAREIGSTVTDELCSLQALVFALLLFFFLLLLFFTRDLRHSASATVKVHNW